MLARAYKRLRDQADRLNDLETGAGFFTKFWLNTAEGLLIFLGLIITSPFFLALGSYRSFSMFARQHPDQTWIDSYSDWVRCSRITSAGIIALIVILVFNLVVFYFTPVVILWLKAAFGAVVSPFLILFRK